MRDSGLSDKIIECLAGSQPMEYKQIAVDINKTHGNVSVALVRLLRNGEVQRVSRGVYALSDWEPNGNGEYDSQPVSQPIPPTPKAPIYVGNEFHDINLLEMVSTLNRWLANYTGPSDEPVAIEIVLAMEHIKRAIELRDERLKPILAEALKESGTKPINVEVG